MSPFALNQVSSFIILLILISGYKSQSVVLANIFEDYVIETSVDELII